MEVNTFLLVAVGVLLLWMATTGRLKNVGPAWRVLIAK